MMSVSQHSRSSKTLYLLVQLSLCLGILLLEATVVATELPAEMMLEGVSLLQSMEYAKENQQHHQQSQQKPHVLHELAKRFPFHTNSAAGADVDMNGMQPPALSPGDISRLERELFLQGALDDETTLAVDDVELPLVPDSMEHADLMERTIDYKQHQPSAPMWLQQHKSSGAEGGIGSSTFLKMHQPYQKQKQLHHDQQSQHQKHVHHLNGDDASITNSDTLAPPPLPPAEPQRRCAIEITTKVTGVCQAMAPIAAACVAGDYMDVYNQDCM